MSEKVTVFVGTGSAPDPSPPGIVTKDYIESADIDARIAAAIAAFALTLAPSFTIMRAIYQSAVATVSGWLAITSAVATTSSTEIQWSFPTARTLKAFRIVSTLSSGASFDNPFTVTVRKNGVDTACVIAYAANERGTKSNLTAISFAAGDLLSVRIDWVGGTVTGVIQNEFTFEWSPISP